MLWLDGNGWGKALDELRYCGIDEVIGGGK